MHLGVLVTTVARRDPQRPNLDGPWPEQSVSRSNGGLRPASSGTLRP